MSGPGGAHIDPDRERAGATKFDVAADRLEQVHQDLQRQLQEQGPCWGADESGQAFAKDYEPGADGMEQALQSLTGALRSMREQVQGVADDSQATDQRNAEVIGGAGN